MWNILQKYSQCYWLESLSQGDDNRIGINIWVVSLEGTRKWWNQWNSESSYRFLQA